MFGHVIPLRSVRNMLIADFITIEQALNSPTCLIKPDANALLGANKLTKKTPNPWFFWQRYRLLSIDIETYDGTAVDIATWDLAAHYQYFS